MGKVPEVMDVALDKHTYRGLEMEGIHSTFK